MTETIVNKLRLQNILNSAIKEITKPENRDFNKRAALTLYLLIIAVLASQVSIGLMAACVEILLESGVSEILIQRIVGFGLCILGVLVAGIAIIDLRRALRNVLWSKKHDTEKSL